MRQHLFFKSIILAALFFAFESLAQNPAPSQDNSAPNDSTFSEKTLPDETQKKPDAANVQAKTAADSSKDSSTPDKKPAANTASSLMKNSALIDKISGSVSEILLGNKVTSLMFDEEENSNIDRAVESLRNNQVYSPDGSVIGNKEGDGKTEQEKIEENEKSYLYLASIIYFSPKDWAIWINDQKITPDNNKRENELYVKEVSRDGVRFLWKLSVSKWKILSGRPSEEMAPKVNRQNQVEVEFTLRQNQTYILSTKSVVEGKAVIALLKKKQDEKKAAEDSKNKPAAPQTTPDPATTPKQ